MAENRTLLLIDVMPLLYRGHFAFANRPRMTASGVNTSAIFIFTTLVLQMLREDGTTHAALAMDTSPTFRHDKYPPYKAQREKMPEDISASIPMAEEFAATMRIPFIRVPGFEADDVIGTLSAKADAAGFSKICMFTPDKDFAQLVSDRVFLCRPSKNDSGFERYGVEEVREKWGVYPPSQMIDFLALAGDASDNIPGIDGIGEKTAVKLLAEYGCVENIIARADELKGKLRERVEAHTEDARISRWLAEIRKDAPVPLSLDDLRICEPDMTAVTAFCSKYELNTVLKKITGASEQSDPVSAPTQCSTNFGDLPLFAGLATASVSNDVAVTQVPTVPEFSVLSSWPHVYHTADTPEKVDELLALLLRPGRWAFDTETTGLDPWINRLVGMSFSIREGDAWYVPLPDDDDARAILLEKFRPAFARTDVVKIGHNLKFDISMLRHAGLNVSGPLWDTMLAHYVCDPASRHGMDILSRSLLGYSPIPITDLIGEKGQGQLTMDQVPLDKISEYAAEDADVTMRLFGKLKVLVAENEAEDALGRCENALLPVLLDMESEGININPDVLYLQGTELAAEIAELERMIKHEAGTEFNLASPKQLGEVLFDVLKLPPPGKTKSGQYETSEDVLASLAGSHPIIDLILRHRACVKLKSTYIDKLPLCIRPETGRIHSSFNQALTETGRLSSDNPNLQNIPVRTERGRRIRQAFIPRSPDYVLMSADYSQVELRMIASMSGDETMIQAFKDDKDIHSATAARVNKIEIGEVTSEMRSQAKMVNFGIVYGITAFGLSQRLKISRKNASELIDGYFKMFPAIRLYMEKTIADAREKGYSTTMLGHRRPLRDINSRNANLRGMAERFAINTPVQGSAAELIKLAMIAVHSELRARNLKTKLILQIHDELILDVPKTEVDEVREIVKNCMENAMTLAVPLKVDIGIGDNWMEAH